MFVAPSSVMLYIHSSLKEYRLGKAELNKIAARWPVMAVAQFYFIGN
jgi:hypothetical protein